MELQGFHTPIVAASLAPFAFVDQGFLANCLPPFPDGIDEVLTTISVCAPLNHRFTPFFYSRPLYQLSYRGTQSVVFRCFSIHLLSSYKQGLY